MKKTDIKIDGVTEYAVTPNDYGRTGQAAGDARLERAVVLAIHPPLYGKAGKAVVRYLDQGTTWSGEPNPLDPAGRTRDLSTRNIVALWDEHVEAKAAREQREAEAQAEHERAANALNEKIKYLNKVLPESLVPRWAKSDIRFQTESGYVSVDQLLAIIDHARSEGVLDADDVTRYDAP